MPTPDITLVEEFPGYFVKRDATQLSPGSLISGSKNVGINDGDRIANRFGSIIDGSTSSATTPIKSKHTFKKRNGVEIPMRTYGTVIEYRHPTLGTWQNLINNATTGLVYGFADHNINSDYTDRVVFCNGKDPYSHWTGAYDLLNGALVGAEATIPVDTTLTDFVFYSGTASATTTTTLTIAASEWATDLWTGTSGNRFLVYFTSGSEAGKVSDITATTSTQITFTVIAGLSGTPTFEIRRAKFALSGSLRIGTSDVTYSGITATSFTGCSGTPVAADNAAVTQAISQALSAPRGNIIVVEKTRVFVSGAEKSSSSVYYSKIASATDFSFSATRVATDGGIIDTPEGGGAVTGLGIQESFIYILKNDLIKSLYFTQDGTDLPVIETVVDAPNVGANFSKGVFKIDNQIYYTTRDGGVKTVTRVENVNTMQALQLSDPISAYVKTLDFTAPAGIFFRQKAYIACRTTDSTYNNVVLVYNFQKQAWEAPHFGWNVSAWAIYGNDLYFGSSVNPETYKVDDERYDDNGNFYESVARFAAWNFGYPTLPKSTKLAFLEGYITENTTITIKLLYNYNGSQEERSTTLSGSESAYIVASASYNTLGSDALALDPLASTVEVTDDINKFRVYLTTTEQPFYEMSLEVSSESAGDRWELLRFGYEVVVKPAEVQSLQKKLA
jgi:hypothetical protein